MCMYFFNHMYTLHIWRINLAMTAWLNDWQFLSTQFWVACSSCIFCACICSSFEGETTAASGSYLSLVQLIPWDPQTYPITITILIAFYTNINLQTFLNLKQTSKLLAGFFVLSYKRLELWGSNMIKMGTPPSRMLRCDPHAPNLGGPKSARKWMELLGGTKKPTSTGWWLGHPSEKY